MKKLHLLFVIFASISLGVLAAVDNNVATELAKEAPTHKDIQKDSEGDTFKDDPDLVKAVEAALKGVKEKAPDVQKEALRVWKNYKAGGKSNFTYRFWGRSVIEWLQKNKGMAFKSARDVEKIFLILWHKKLISYDAVRVLTTDSWGHTVYEQGEPAFNKRVEDYREPGGGIVPDAVNQKRAEISL
jgi:hypothetical protein